MVFHLVTVLHWAYTYFLCYFRDLVDEAKNYLLLPQERPLMQGPRTRPRKPIRCGEVLFAGWHLVLFFCYQMNRTVVVVVVLFGGLRKTCTNPSSSLVFSSIPPCLAVGGWCSGDAISSVERYDPQTNEWRMVASMSKRRCGVGVSVLDDLLYAVGGHDGSSYLNSVERWSLELSCSLASSFAKSQKVWNSNGISTFLCLSRPDMTQRPISGAAMWPPPALAVPVWEWLSSAVICTP